METIYEKINHLNELVLDGKTLEAFDTYYHEDVVMQENDNEPVVGKSLNRRREEEFLEALTEFRGAQPLKVTVGDKISMVEWSYDFTHRDWGVRNFTQVSVQEWKDGQIIKEKFYYAN